MLTGALIPFVCYSLTEGNFDPMWQYHDGTTECSHLSQSSRCTFQLANWLTATAAASHGARWAISQKPTGPSGRIMGLSGANRLSFRTARQPAIVPKSSGPGARSDSS